MKKTMKVFLLSLFFYGLGAVAESGQALADEKLPVFQRIVITKASEDRPELNSNEPPGSACKGFEITEKDVREFLSLAKRVNFEIAYEKLPKTRCQATIELTTQDGKKATMYIDRSRLGSITFWDEAEHFYCGECRNKQYYETVSISSKEAIEAQRHAATTAVLEAVAAGNYKNVTIHSKRGEPPEACKGFDLTETDVREFFKKARILINVPYHEAAKINKATVPELELMERPNCIAEGYAQLQDESPIVFAISRGRIGSLLFAPQSALNKDQIAFFICDQCQSKKFYPPAGKKPAQ